jgi:hypothetical protein
MATKYIIVKSAGDNYNFITWPIYDGTVGHTEEYAKRLARKVSATMKIVPELLEALEATVPALLAYSNSGLMECQFEDEDGYSIPLRIARAAIAKATGKS